jgi:hypothetical protein
VPAAPATTVDPHAVTAPVLPHDAVPSAPHGVDPHAVVAKVSAALGFSPWWLLLLVVAMVGGALIGKQRAQREGQDTTQGLISGLRDGATYGAAALGVISLISSWFGFYFVIQAIIILVGTIGGAAKNFHNEINQAEVRKNAGRGLLTALLLITGLNFLWVTGIGHYVLAVIFGFIGGVGTSAVITKKTKEVFGSITSDFVSVLKSDSSRFGMWGAFGAVTFATVMFGAFGAVPTLILSLVAGGVAAYLTTKGTSLATAPAVEAEPHIEVETGHHEG